MDVSSAVGIRLTSESTGQGGAREEDSDDHVLFISVVPSGQNKVEAGEETAFGTNTLSIKLNMEYETWVRSYLRRDQA